MTSSSTFLHGANVRANGIRQHYLRYGGKGRAPVVLVPGITSPAITWGFVAERFGQHFDTYVLDVRGRGLSEASADARLRPRRLRGRRGAFADALAATRYALVGHSMGARIGIRAARRQPRGLDAHGARRSTGLGPGPARLPGAARRGISTRSA